MSDGLGLGNVSGSGGVHGNCSAITSALERATDRAGAASLDDAVVTMVIGGASCVLLFVGARLLHTSIFLCALAACGWLGVRATAPLRLACEPRLVTLAVVAVAGACVVACLAQRVLFVLPIVASGIVAHFVHDVVTGGGGDGYTAHPHSYWFAIGGAAAGAAVLVAAARRPFLVLSTAVAGGAGLAVVTWRVVPGLGSAPALAIGLVLAAVGVVVQRRLGGSRRPSRGGLRVAGTAAAPRPPAGRGRHAATVVHSSSSSA
jgi:hypothetical protein